ncbi:hypothetical protein F164LOC_18345 [Pectobacterium carotovorum]|uniref:hypothetical protein n=1 Tax=Pectobacterium versatile TaxID=2488639 RepID=UPI000C7EAA56|nr:hypothetical protein [Pectobacterium versatile]PLY35854.1 hypothetical protein F164LOC_18345 [Pectobacterium carotovorum]
MDKFSEEFIKIITKHIETIPEDEYKQHTALSEHGQSLYADNTWRGFACRATRRELIEQAWSVNAIKPCNYISVFRNEKTVTIGHIEMDLESEQINSPVYYFPDRGIYAAACGNNRVYDAWLSWPCYPHGW